MEVTGPVGVVSIAIASSPDNNGMDTENVLPLPTPGLDAVTEPPWSSMSDRAKWRPRPNPPFEASSERSA